MTSKIHQNKSYDFKITYWLVMWKTKVHSTNQISILTRTIRPLKNQPLVPKFFGDAKIIRVKSKQKTQKPYTNKKIPKINHQKQVTVPVWDYDIVQHFQNHIQRRASLQYSMSVITSKRWTDDTRQSICEVINPDNVITNNRTRKLLAQDLLLPINITKR